jgi:hypothetical protein
VTERGEKGESWADTGLVGRKEGCAGGLLGALRAEEVRRAGEKEEERRWATLGWNERRGEEERFGFSLFFFKYLFSNFQKFKLFQNLFIFKLFSKNFKSN